MWKSFWLYPGVILALHSGACAQGEAPERELLEAERIFAQAVAQHGIRDAFLTYLADSAVVFSPGPLPGKKVYAGEPPSTSLLTWFPVYIEASSSGDLGYTTGPWELKKRSTDEEPVAFGEYVSVWQRQEDGTWRVVLDVGVGHPRPSSRDSGQVSYGADSRSASSIEGPEKKTTFAQLLSADRTLSRLAEERGYGEALSTVASDDIRLLRGGAFPVRGRDSIRVLGAQPTGSLHWKADGVNVARSGDLGYTYGTGQTADHKEHSYVRIWRREGNEWKVVVDLVK